MKMYQLSLPEKSRHSRKRIGRGDGSGRGKTSGKGEKGQNARSGGGVRLGFEGGQMPLFRRLPKRGFRNIFKKHYQLVKLSDLATFPKDSVVDIQFLKEKSLISSLKLPVKLLASSGDFSVSLSLKVHACSQSARKIVEGSGGKVEIIS